MARPANDYSTYRTPYLTVIKRAPPRDGSLNAWWTIRCVCGTERDVSSGSLSKNIQSCGCMQLTLIGRAKTQHGKARKGKRSRVYRTWDGMRQRCQNPNQPHYERYGGRGIRVCDRWQSFEAFYADMGDPPSDKHSIDRIDNSGNYEPGNCRWATVQEQALNKRKRRTKAAILGELYGQHFT